MKIKWYWVIYLIVFGISCVTWFNPGMLLIFSVVALIILLIEQRNDKGVIIHNVYCDIDDDDDEFEKPK